MTRLFTLVLFLTLAAPAAWAGSCDHSWDTAADGSNCGGRAADQRPGGTGGPYYPTR